MISSCARDRELEKEAIMKQRPSPARHTTGILLWSAVGATVTMTASAHARPTSRARTRIIAVNGARLSDARIRSLEQRNQIRIPNGRYWYDQVSGAWGLQGGPTRGFTLSGLSLGAPLPADASHGNTSIFINGRELPWPDLAALQQIVPWTILRGRYWVDARGNAGRLGEHALCNLLSLARAAGRGRGGPWSVHTRTTDAHVGGDGRGFLFYIDRDTSWNSD